MDEAPGDAPGGLVLVGHPSADVYGADLQLLDSVTGLVGAGWRVLVSVPSDGPLVPLLRARGAQVRFDDVPVVRRSAMSVRGAAALATGGTTGTVRLARLIRRVGADVVLANTVTVPVWVAAARLARRPVAVHVHEAEDGDPLLVRRALLAPLLLASRVIANSGASRDFVVDVHPRLAARTTVVRNGIAGAPSAAEPPAPWRPGCGRPFRLVVVGRLSPRKAPDAVLEAVASLRAEGRDVAVTLCGTSFAGYEWFEAELQARAARPDLAGAVAFAGYVNPMWPVLAESDALLAPSVRESFGNAVVEAQLGARPVVASTARGHLETVRDGETGLLVPPADAAALATAVRSLMDDPDRAARIARTGRSRALEEFTVERYHAELTGVVRSLAKRP